MGLMAGVASDSPGMIGGHDLWKRFGLGAVGLVTTGTDDCGIQLGGSYRGRVLGVVGKRSMACLAWNYHVLAQLLLVYDFGMATLADLMSGKCHGTSRDLGDGISAIVAVLPEATGNHRGAKKDESDRRNGHDQHQPNEMFYVLEHSTLLFSPSALPRWSRRSALLMVTFYPDLER